MTTVEKAMKFCGLGSAVVLLLSACQLAQADTFYWTNIGGSQIETVTTPGNATTVVLSPSAPFPDSLIFNAAGTQIIYTSLEGSTPGVFAVNTDGTGNHQIATSAQLGGSNFVQDLALEPSGNSVLVSTTDTGRLYRINLTTNAVTLVATLGSGLRGITYDAAGDLFALVSGSVIEQINPVTGAVINSHSLAGGDGLTYDSVTGNLFAGSGNQIFEIPTNLSSVTTFTCAICGSIDGTESDGNGHIDLADPGTNSIEQFTIAGATFAHLANTPGIDDIAPVAGLGAPPSTVPEPSSILLLGTLCGLASRKFRKKSRSTAFSLGRREFSGPRFGLFR